MCEQKKITMESFLVCLSIVGGVKKETFIEFYRIQLTEANVLFKLIQSISQMFYIVIQNYIFAAF